VSSSSSSTAAARAARSTCAQRHRRGRPESWGGGGRVPPPALPHRPPLPPLAAVSALPEARPTENKKLQEGEREREREGAFLGQDCLASFVLRTLAPHTRSPSFERQLSAGSNQDYLQEPLEKSTFELGKKRIGQVAAKRMSG